MKLSMINGGVALFAAGVLSATAYAAPLTLNETQLDSVAAGGVEMTAGFVCPVLTTSAVLNSPKGGELGVEGYYTIGATSVMVPVHATNTLDNGQSGSPAGPFAMPGDTGYTAIWNVGS
jgi:hypothetical protein